MCIFMAFICAISDITLKFQNHDDLKPRDRTTHPNFIIIVISDGFRIFLNAKNHRYVSRINMLEDPCNYKITGTFGWADGFYNPCSSQLQFVYRSKLYKIAKEGEKWKLLGTSPVNMDRMQETGSMLYSKHGSPDISPIEQEYFKTNTGIDMYNLKSQLPYKIDIFILNSFERTERHGRFINQNTSEIFSKVKEIFDKSKMLVEPKLSGILNINTKIDFFRREGGPLLAFKAMIEPTRFFPFNLRTPLAMSDLVILIAEGEGDHNSTGQIHGMTFQGGSVRLDSSYSVVLTSPKDGTYFLAKKIAHEIGHALGARHTPNGLMEARTCKSCEQEERLFNDTSRSEINGFLKRNTRVLAVKQQVKYSEVQPLKNVDEAIEYAEERRRHTLMDIVKSKLNGRFPTKFESELSVIIILCLYGAAVIALMFYSSHRSERYSR